MNNITFDAILEKAVTNYTYQLARVNDIPKAHRHSQRTIEVSMVAVNMLHIWNEPLTFNNVKEVVKTVYDMRLLDQVELFKQIKKRLDEKEDFD